MSDPTQELTRRFNPGPGDLAYFGMPLHRLPRAEQESVAALLLSAAQGGDPLALQSLIFAQLPHAGAALRDAPLPTDPAGHHAMLRARACLLADVDALEALIRSLPRVGLIEQMLAVDAFARVPGEPAVQGLIAAVQVDDVNVRQAAFGPLLARLGVAAPDPSYDRGPLAALFLRLVSELSSTWRPAAQRLGRFAQAVLAGSVDPLGEPYRPGPQAAFQAALDTLNGPKSDAIEPSLLIALQGDDRAWVDASLLSRIGDHDLRAMDAATALRIKGARVAIEEALRRFGPTDPQLTVAAQANLSFLRGSGH